MHKEKCTEKGLMMHNKTSFILITTISTLGTNSVACTSEKKQLPQDSLEVYVQDNLDPSFYEIEEMLRAMAQSRENEVLFMYDGAFWSPIVEHATQYSAGVDKDAISFALAYAPDDSIYFYHQHTFLNGEDSVLGSSVHPPSSRDILFHAGWKKEAVFYEKHIISRVVDVYGIWEYDVQGAGPFALENEELSVFASIEPNKNISKFDDTIIRILKEQQERVPSEQFSAVLPAYNSNDILIRYTEF